MGFKKHHDILIYSSPDCKLCELCKSYFRDKGMDYLEFMINKDRNAEIKMKEISEQDTTPVVEFDGRVIVGYRPDLFDQLTAEPTRKEEEKEDAKKALNFD